MTAATTFGCKPVSKDILIQNLQNNDRYRLVDSGRAATEERLKTISFEA